ncbi:plasmodium falciparum CPW-WPC domain-containing protein, putative [Eimeria maxima]|uniref:Plasmodium falciparum CPW-WPC domain-containing protein, putative n=1 Tax=Eimeria maxima TaxID=5804 RepID=U6LYJ8_EIMMA|nr:plasmodium falciparum CPW-WPC domain-containing protein, putative [Eimeria maxima]CDJ55948.1 plasmodium falciparum CPW-WPC domain-containing protein, putative [Eimeria maxima]
MLKSAAPLTPPTPSPPAASDINKLLSFDEKRQKDCNDLKRKLQVEKSTVRKLTQEEKVAQCQREIDPEAEKMEALTESNKEMEEKKRERELPLRGYDLSVLQRELEEQQQQQQQPQQQEPVIELLTEQRFCPHDFSVLCPFAWIPIGDESSCKAPEAYIGSCERQMNFAVSQSEKEQLEDQCLISWPWEDNGICEAPFSYSGEQGV